MKTLPTLHPIISKVLARIKERSKDSRAKYLDMIKRSQYEGFARSRLNTGNLAHAAAGCSAMDKLEMLGGNWPNLAIISAYNDMLSAHRPYETYPEFIRKTAREAGATAQMAGGVPAMCDGVTQGKTGMELSLFSRDVIAMSSAIALSHDAFDAGIHLGICDKIVPGLVIAALQFGAIPHVFIPSGPMPSGLPNKDKIRIRQNFAEGKIGEDELLKAESESYHSPGTCTFYGTANSNQMLMEIMGLHLPGASFVPPGSPLREALTRLAVRRAVEMSKDKSNFAMGYQIDERSFVNAIIGLVATGGSTNHVLHIPAMAAAAGIKITLEDFHDITAVTPLLCNIYPNGSADINDFHNAGGMAFIIRELLSSGLLIGDAGTIWGNLSEYCQTPYLENGEVKWETAPQNSLDMAVIRPASQAFEDDGGLRVTKSMLGTGVIKISAIPDDKRVITAPARVFDSQEEFKTAYDEGKFTSNFIAIVRFQGPSANGMPELHSLMPILGALQDKGLKVALITDGRMSGASGKVPAAIHMSPEAAAGGPLAYICDGDIISLDCQTGVLNLDVSEQAFQARTPKMHIESEHLPTHGLSLFEAFRNAVGNSEQGASLFNSQKEPMT